MKARYSVAFHYNAKHKLKGMVHTEITSSTLKGLCQELCTFWQCHAKNKKIYVGRKESPGYVYLHLLGANEDPLRINTCFVVIVSPSGFKAINKPTYLSIIQELISRPYKGYEVTTNGLPKGGV